MCKRNAIRALNLIVNFILVLLIIYVISKDVAIKFLLVLIATGIISFLTGYYNSMMYLNLDKESVKYKKKVSKYMESFIIKAIVIIILIILVKIDFSSFVNRGVTTLNKLFSNLLGI